MSARFDSLRRSSRFRAPCFCRDIHDLQKEKDERREKVLSEMGLRVVRFGNDEGEGCVRGGGEDQRFDFKISIKTS